MRGLAALVFGAVLATIVGCGAREIAVELDFEPDAIAEGARAVEVFVVPSCTGASLDAAPSDPLHHAIVRRTGSMALGGSLPERFGVLALARDTSCGLVAAGCADATRSVDRVRVTLSARSGSTCRACDDGVCGGRLDAGPDDASATDASVDDALVATPETGCDCVDEDADGSVDEGCAERGAGTVAFQRVLDGPGADALRGAVVGGDGRVWLNGWLGADGFDYGCGVTVGVMGEPQRGPSYLFALDPDDGRCRAMFVRTRDVASSFGMPWPAVGGAWLYTPGGLTRFAMVEGETVAMMPGADFTAGFVAPADDASDLLLLYTARGFAGTAHVGDASVMATNQGLLARVTSTGATWLRAVAPVALAARLSGSAFALVVPNEGASPCGSVVGESRIEIRDAAAPDTCLDVVALPVALAAADEMAATASHGRLWVIARQADDRVLLATYEPGGVPVVRTLPSSAPSSPLVHLTPVGPVSSQDVIVGAAADPGGNLDGAPIQGGYVVRASFDRGSIALGAPRRLGTLTMGVGARADGRLFVTSHAVSGDALCRGTPTLTTDADGARLVTAIDL